MKKTLVLMVALAMTLSLAACGGGASNEDITPPAVEEWTYKDVAPEQIQAISDVLVELTPLYNEAATAAIENGWEADEITAQELSLVYALLESGRYGVADPSEYEGATDMDAVVEQYQSILGAMPDLIAKVSEPYGK